MGRRFRSYGPEDTLVKTRMFSIHIPMGNVVKYPQHDWERFIKFFREHCEGEVEVYRDPVGRMWAFRGTASSKVISTLMAVARGHDLVALLDEFEKEK